MKAKRDNSINQYAVVVGAVNIDICGTPRKPLIERDSNPGTIKTSVGGVGRNIAHNLKLLGADVKLITVTGGDAEAKIIAQSCEQLNIDISDSLIVPDAATSRYMFITDEKGDMRLAVNDMSIYESMTPQFIREKLEVINGAGICIADANIPRETLEYLAQNCSVPLFVDPVSVAKSRKLSNILDKIHALKPNVLEAQELARVRTNDEESLEMAAAKLIASGLKSVFITMGGDGVLYADEEECGILPCLPGRIVNTTGAGDSLTAAAAWAYLCGLSARDAAKAGLAASAICLESKEAVNPRLSREKLLLRGGIAL